MNYCYLQCKVGHFFLDDKIFYAKKHIVNINNSKKEELLVNNSYFIMENLSKFIIFGVKKEN